MFVRRRNHLKDKSLYESGFWYFVTVCVEGRKNIFDIKSSDDFRTSSILLNGDNGKTLGDGDTVVAATMLTNIVVGSLFNLYVLYENIILDEWVIMPNHIHFIIGFNGAPLSKITNKKSDLGSIIKSFKLYAQKQIVAATTVSPSPSTEPQPSIKSQIPKGINYHKIWQKSYFDHIIRGGEDLERIQEYVLYNPQNWDKDNLNPISLQNTDLPNPLLLRS